MGKPTLQRQLPRLGSIHAPGPFCPLGKQRSLRCVRRVLAFSPLLGAFIASALGKPVDLRSAVAVTWVGAGSSFPASLALAGAFGRRQLEAYWVFLESFPGSPPRKHLVFVWACFSLVLLLVGVAALLLA